MLMLQLLKIRCHKHYSQISITFACVKGNAELLSVTGRVLSFPQDLMQQPCKNPLGVSDSDSTGKECSSFTAGFTSPLQTRDPSLLTKSLPFSQGK